MKNGKLELLVAAIAIITFGINGVAWADGPGGSFGHDMMMSSWGWWGMVFGPLMMIAIVAAIVVVVVLILRWLGGVNAGTSMPPAGTAAKTPLDILKERFAKGEIEKDEFEEKRRILGD